MYQPTLWEQKEIERLGKKDVDEPEFVTKAKQRMIKRIKEGRSDEIIYDEWGEVYYPTDPDLDD